MRIAVCDDNEIDRGVILAMTEQVFAPVQLHPELVPYADSASLVADVQEGTWFDIILLDIYMGEVLGINVAHQLRSLGFDGGIVFITSSPDFAIEGYDVGAAGYILKPVSPEKLEKVMGQLVRSFHEETYTINFRSAVARIPLSEILYVESSNTKCIIHRWGGSDYTVYKKLDEIEQELDDKRFLRCHRSYLVNMDHVREVEKSFILTSGEVVLIRQRELKTIRETYLEYAARKQQSMEQAPK